MKQTPAHTVVNNELLSLIPKDARHVVDVGCMHGQMAGAYKAINSNCIFTGIDIDAEYAAAASKHCDKTFAGDIELFTKDQLSELFPSDCWIFGDCLEHLKNPWELLRTIRAHLDSDGCVLVCIPNAQHWSIQWKLASGNFRYEESGLLDRTHLRWFTRVTLLEMFSETGWRPEVGMARNLPLTGLENDVMNSIRQFALACGIDPQQALTDAKPFQYVFKLVPG